MRASSAAAAAAAAAAAFQNKTLGAFWMTIAHFRSMNRRALSLLLLLSCAVHVFAGNIITNTDPITNRPFYSSGSYSAAWEQTLIDGLPLCRSDMVPPNSFSNDISAALHVCGR
jgi:hypothetical protein